MALTPEQLASLKRGTKLYFLGIGPRVKLSNPGGALDGCMLSGPAILSGRFVRRHESGLVVKIRKGHKSPWLMKPENVFLTEAEVQPLLDQQLERMDLRRILASNPIKELHDTRSDRKTHRGK